MGWILARFAIAKDARAVPVHRSNRGFDVLVAVILQRRYAAFR